MNDPWNTFLKIRKNAHIYVQKWSENRKYVNVGFELKNPVEKVAWLVFERLVH